MSTVTRDYALSASSDQTVRVWNWQTGEHLRTLEGHTRAVNSVVVSGDYALSASDDQTVRVWNWQTGEHLRTFEGHTSFVRSVVVSGDYALSTSDDQTVRVWNWHTGDCLYTLHLEAPVRSAVFTEDMSHIVAGDDAGNVHFLRPNAAPPPAAWDVADEPADSEH